MATTTTDYTRSRRKGVMSCPVCGRRGMVQLYRKGHGNQADSGKVTHSETVRVVVVGGLFPFAEVVAWDGCWLSAAQVQALAGKRGG